ncbi:DUF2480 family protein [Flavobacterium sp.]|uniref:DUF2480 family protein n=1 Tax=Flavobacterium sp. TaxID=239 RepID=UPI0035291888
MDEIVNKVAQSSLEVFDLENYFPDNTIVELDISVMVIRRCFVKRKRFSRTTKKTFDWTVFKKQICWHNPVVQMLFFQHGLCLLPLICFRMR